jgi:hypothetical protein
MMDDYLQFVVHWLDDPEAKKEVDDNYGEDCKPFCSCL